MGFRKALGKNTSSSFHVLFTVEGNRTLEGILTICFMPVKHEYSCCFCDHLALQTASPLTCDQPSLVYSRGAKSKGRPHRRLHHLRLLNTVRRTHCTDTTRNRMQTDAQVFKSMCSFGTMVYPAIRRLER